MCVWRFRGWCSASLVPPYLSNTDCCNPSYGLCAFNRFNCVSLCVVPRNCSKPEQPVITNSPWTVIWWKYDCCLTHTLPRSIKVNAEDLLRALVNPLFSVPECVKQVWTSVDLTQLFAIYLSSWLLNSFKLDFHFQFFTSLKTEWYMDELLSATRRYSPIYLDHGLLRPFSFVWV